MSRIARTQMEDVNPAPDAVPQRDAAGLMAGNLAPETP